MSRPAPKRLTRPQFAQLGPGLLALGLAAAASGCADSAPRADSTDPAALRKAVEERRVIKFSSVGRKAVPVSGDRLRTNAASRPAVGKSVKTPVKSH